MRTKEQQGEAPGVASAVTATQAPDEVSAAQAVAYAAPVVGSWFFYIPMWSILPGVYVKDFGLSLSSVAMVVLVIRIFDGVSDTSVGYLADRHRANGGSRKPWVMVGAVGLLISSYFLFNPTQPVTTGYYLCWSCAFFLAFTMADIPHLAWGSELTQSYEQRAKVYGVRNILQRLGMVCFYAFPLLPIFASHDYTPEALAYAVYVGAVMIIIGVIWIWLAAPSGRATRVSYRDAPRLFVHSLVRNKPLLLYFSAFACGGLCTGMWYGLVYMYMDSYLWLGHRVATMFLLGTCVAALSTPVWLKLIAVTSKSTAWATSIVLFLLQLLASWFVEPGSPWWVACLLVAVANVCFCGVDVAAVSILGDVVDYGKWKFKRDRGTTYFALNILVLKLGLGIGGGLALALAGATGFSPSDRLHTWAAIMGLKFAFIVLPACFAVLGFLAVVRMPLDRRQHAIIRRRLASRPIEGGA